MSLINWKHVVWIGLVSGFLVYTARLYSTQLPNDTLSANAQTGKRLWQQHNCQACHQLYGLGGYLGPDLTNVYSTPGKGPAYIRAMLQTGSAVMPAQHLGEQEMNAITDFLKATDRTGNADPRSFQIEPTGNIYAAHAQK